MTVTPGAKLNFLLFISIDYKYFNFILNQVKKYFSVLFFLF